MSADGATADGAAGVEATRAWFGALADAAFDGLTDDEVLLVALDGEDTDYVRFNSGAIRQAGSVRQRQVQLDLVAGARHSRASVELSGELEADRRRLVSVMAMLRDQRRIVPDDPYLLLATEPAVSDHFAEGNCPDPAGVVDRIVDVGGSVDAAMVGIYTAGRTFTGFAGSLGQRHWSCAASFDLDWSFHVRADVSSKHRYAGTHWDDDAFTATVDRARHELAVLVRPVMTLPPGGYRTLLAPAAVGELLELLSWDGFGTQAHRTRQTPLLHMIDGEASFAIGVRLTEDTAGGVAPHFNDEGFVRPDAVELIVDGRYRDTLVSPRSAQEFDLTTNGASGWEVPESLAMAPGTLPGAQALAALGTGLAVGNLWYTNWSDPTACRITGMTRFATFWVEDGELVAPVAVLRFDDTLYRVFGDCLEALTDRAELLLDASTYERRSTASIRTPGALVSDLAYTL